MWYRIRHRRDSSYWDGHTWTEHGKVYFSRDSIRRAFRNTNGYLHNLNRSKIEIVEYDPQVNDHFDADTVIT